MTGLFAIWYCCSWLWDPIRTTWHGGELECSFGSHDSQWKSNNSGRRWKHLMAHSLVTGRTNQRRMIFVGWLYAIMRVLTLSLECHRGRRWLYHDERRRPPHGTRSLMEQGEFMRYKEAAMNVCLSLAGGPHDKWLPDVAPSHCPIVTNNRAKRIRPSIIDLVADDDVMLWTRVCGQQWPSLRVGASDYKHASSNKMPNGIQGCEDASLSSIYIWEAWAVMTTYQEHVFGAWLVAGILHNHFRLIIMTMTGWWFVVLSRSTGWGWPKI